MASVLPLLARLLLTGDRLLRTLAGASVGLGPLTVDRQAATMTQALVATDLHLALDVLRDVAPQVTFDLEVGVDVGADAVDLFVGEVTHPGVGVEAELGDDLLRGRLPDAGDVGEADLQPLLARDVDP